MVTIEKKEGKERKKDGRGEKEREKTRLDPPTTLGTEPATESRIFEGHYYTGLFFFFYLELAFVILHLNLTNRPKV